MSSFRQIDANRRNARLSTGPITEEGKKRSRRNAIRHGLTAETVIDALEDAEDYAAFEMAVTADYDAPSAVERELVLRLASLLWRLRRATAIETGLFQEQARQLLQFRQPRQTSRNRRKMIDGNCLDAIAKHEGLQDQAGPAHTNDALSSAQTGSVDQFDDLTDAFLRLSHLPTCPLDRLGRYEAALWRQASQILFTLRCLNRGRPWNG
jgi:hypothetical protein